MKNKENLDDELKGIAPFLQSLKKQDDGRKVPPGYFDQFEASLFQKIAETGATRPGTALKTQPKGLKATFTKPRLLMSVAAAITLLFSAFWFLKPQTAVEATQPIAMELSADEVEDYLLDNITDFDSEQLVSLSDADPLSAPKTTIDPSGTKQHKPELDVKPEDMAPLLDEMSDEELEQLL